MKRITFALAALATSAVFAQGAATILSVEGLVTQATGDALTNVGSDTVLVANSRVTVGAGGRIVIRFPSGCTATVLPGQSLQISETACTAFVAQQTPPRNPVAQFVSDNPVVTSVLGLGLLVAANNTGGGGAAAPVVTTPAVTPTPVAVITPTPVVTPISPN